MGNIYLQDGPVYEQTHQQEDIEHSVVGSLHDADDPWRPQRLGAGVIVPREEPELKQVFHNHNCLQRHKCVAFKAVLFSQAKQ